MTLLRHSLFDRLLAKKAYFNLFVGSQVFIWSVLETFQIVSEGLFPETGLPEMPILGHP
jgi:hypothetical protein